MNVEEAQKIVFNTCTALHAYAPFGMEGEAMRPWAGQQLQLALARESLLREALQMLQAEHGLGRTMEWTVSVITSGHNSKDITSFLSDEELFKLLLNRIGHRVLQSLQFPSAPLIPNNVQKDAFALGFALGSALSQGDHAIVLEAIKKIGHEPVMEWGRQLVGTVNLVVQFQLVTADAQAVTKG